VVMVNVPLVIWSTWIISVAQSTSVTLPNDPCLKSGFCESKASLQIVPTSPERLATWLTRLCRLSLCSHFISVGVVPAELVGSPFALCFSLIR
jgi:hypothetical protein